MFAVGYACNACGIDLLGIEAVARMGILAKLRPKLAELHALGHALPKLIDALRESLLIHSFYALRRWDSVLSNAVQPF